MCKVDDGDRKGGLKAGVDEDVDFMHGAGMLCGAVCGSQGDQAQADAHRGVRGLDRACECVDGYGVMGMRN